MPVGVDRPYPGHWGGTAAATVLAGQLVAQTASGVVPVSTSNQEPLGLCEFSGNPGGGGGGVPLVGLPAVLKFTAATTVTLGGLVQVASSNGDLGVLPVASGRWIVGRAIESAAAGEAFACHVRPWQAF